MGGEIAMGGERLFVRLFQGRLRLEGEAHYIHRLLVVRCSIDVIQQADHEGYEGTNFNQGPLMGRVIGQGGRRS